MRRASFTIAADPDMTNTAITNKIRRLRFDHGEMTQQQLAERVGVTRQTVNAIELGKYSPSLEVAFRIASAFGVRLEEVFSYESSDKKRTEGRSS
jgi:putative transcriptional regulator